MSRRALASLHRPPGGCLCAGFPGLPTACLSSQLRATASHAAGHHAVGRRRARRRRDAARRDRGHTQVSEGVLAGVDRRIAQAMPAVAFASVLAHAAGPGTVALRVRLVVAYGPSLPVLAAAVREWIVTYVWHNGRAGSRGELSVDDLAGPDI